MGMEKCCSNGLEHSCHVMHSQRVEGFDSTQRDLDPTEFVTRRLQSHLTPGEIHIDAWALQWCMTCL
jgi:hypothetical protein